MCYLSDNISIGHSFENLLKRWGLQACILPLGDLPCLEAKEIDNNPTLTSQDPDSIRFQRALSSVQLFRISKYSSQIQLPSPGDFEKLIE